MIKLTMNGKSIRPDQFGDELKRAIVRQLGDQLRARLESVRHPDTGEFPTVVVDGDSLEKLHVRVEGSAELVALLRERLTPEESAMVEFPALEGVPKAFVSFAWEDKTLADAVSRHLQANGIDTWFADWSIDPGDSMRQKIDEGLSQCTHFIALLTPNSIKKPWVNLEMDAGLLRRVEAKARFIPLRKDLPPSELPPLIKTMLSPSIEDFEAGMKSVVDVIHGVSRKPPLGPAPAAATMPKTGYSSAASAVAKVFVEESTSALFGDPQLTIDQLVEKTRLSPEDLVDAVHELGGMLHESSRRFFPKEELFATFDKHWKDWDPAQDALHFAADIVNDPTFTDRPAEIAKLYGWEPRRLNAALGYMVNRNLILDRRGVGTAPWLMFSVVGTDNARRFVKSRS